jgi:hypothetical protein
MTSSCRKKHNEATESYEGKLPYYGFYPSNKGANYKQLRHNIYGFSIDIPSNWTFGVNGMGDTAVILIYPDGMITERFTEDYESIEIGRIPFRKASLQDCLKNLMVGMRIAHLNIEVLEQTSEPITSKYESLTSVFTWKSKTDLTIIEYITLIKTENDIRTVTVRTARADFFSRKNFYDNIVFSFVPFEPQI